MQILLAVALDCIFGDPKGLPHPVCLVGRIVKFWENIFYSEENARQRGFIFCAAVLLSVAVSIELLLFASGQFGRFIEMAVSVYLLYAALGFRSLKDESETVKVRLVNGDIKGARKFLSYIVGRDTDKLSECSIVKATVETIAESYIDGVFSVLFYMVLGDIMGCAVLLAWVFKAVNTLDSMVGYDNVRYHDFGFASAKLDDIANFIPARLGALIAIAGGYAAGFDAGRGFRVFLRDRLKHKSPNSAHAESVYAGLLGISLGGGAFYGGEFEARPILGDDTRRPQASDITGAHRILNASVIICSLIIFVVSFLY